MHAYIPYSTIAMHVAAIFISAAGETTSHLRCHHHHALQRTCEHSHTIPVHIPVVGFKVLHARPPRPATRKRTSATTTWASLPSPGP
jgi:hypothetical protein